MIISLISLQSGFSLYFEFEVAVLGEFRGKTILLGLKIKPSLSSLLCENNNAKEASRKSKFKRKYKEIPPIPHFQ